MCGAHPAEDLLLEDEAHEAGDQPREPQGEEEAEHAAERDGDVPEAYRGGGRGREHGARRTPEARDGQGGVHPREQAEPAQAEPEHPQNRCGRGLGHAQDLEAPRFERVIGPCLGDADERGPGGPEDAPPDREEGDAIGQGHVPQQGGEEPDGECGSQEPQPRCEQPQPWAPGGPPRDELQALGTAQPEDSHESECELDSEQHTIHHGNPGQHEAEELECGHERNPGDRPSQRGRCDARHHEGPRDQRHRRHEELEAAHAAPVQQGRQQNRHQQGSGPGTPERIGVGRRHLRVAAIPCGARP